MLTPSEADSEEDGRSVSGVEELLAGGAVSCFRRIQHCITLSFRESENIAPADVTKEAAFFTSIENSVSRNIT